MSNSPAPKRPFRTGRFLVLAGAVALVASAVACPAKKAGLTATEAAADR